LFLRSIRNDQPKSATFGIRLPPRIPSTLDPRSNILRKNRHFGAYREAALIHNRKYATVFALHRLDSNVGTDTPVVDLQIGTAVCDQPPKGMPIDDDAPTSFTWYRHVSDGNA